jgi:hypothetical protein
MLRTRNLWALTLLGALAAAGCSSSPGSPDGGDCNYFGVVPLQFGDVEVGGSESTLALQIENLGPSPITFGGIQIEGDAGGAFSVAVPPVPSQLLQPGATPLSVSVIFSPTALGVQQAELEITGDSCTRTVAVSGTGISPPSGGTSGGTGGSCTSVQSTLPFGQVVVGTSLTLPLPVDDCTQTPLVVGDIGPSDIPNTFGEFTLSNGGPPVVLPGQTVVLNVTYTPTSAGSADAALSLEPCINCSSTGVVFGGTGVQGELSCSPNPVVPGEDGGVAVGCTNSGTWPLELTSLDIMAQDGGFALANAPSLLEPFLPGQGFSFVLTFDPLESDGAGGVIELCFVPPGVPGVTATCTTLDIVVNQ